MQNSSDHLLIDEIIAEYEKGHFLNALQKIISSPLVCYEKFASRKNFFLFILINYFDASVFKGDVECYQTLNVLVGYIFQDRLTKTLFDSFYTQIRIEEFFFLTMQNSLQNQSDGNYFSKEINQFFDSLKEKKFEEASKKIAFIPEKYQAFFQKKIEVEKGWQAFEYSRENFAQWIQEHLTLKNKPWHPFAYKTPLLLIDKQPEGEIPLIFLEPLDEINYEDFLAPYIQKECILIVETVAHFYHLLQFYALKKIWEQPQVILYILEIYPQKQWQFQKYGWTSIRSFRPIFMTSRPDLEKYLPLLQQVLTLSLIDAKNEKSNDLNANWLYALAQKILLEREIERYGPARAFALSIKEGLKKWHDSHKGGLPPDASLGAPLLNYLEKSIQDVLKLRKPRAYAPKNRIRLVHVVPQIVDGGHAPTRLLKILCSLADRQWFDLSVYSTERLADRSLEYPSPLYNSPPSSIRGQRSIKYFEKMQVKVLLDPQSATYESAASVCQDTLEKLSTDIVVFHGPDEINSWCSAHTTTPIRILFDHGSLPSSICFDLVILSTQEAYNSYHEAYRKQGMESCFLPFSVDVRAEWKSQPFTREEIHLPEDAFVMTTISNHLENRISSEMFHAISMILKKCPQAVYAPIGRVNYPEKFMKIFEKNGVSQQVYLLGSQSFPSQLARSMNLYLNEFPFGSGLAMLDAMAAGCPVVSMYDEQGPQQGRYAGTYFGLDHVIHSGQVEDYINLACQLINNSEMYQQWSQHALTQYEKRVDIVKYAKNFEKILDEYINYFLHHSSVTPVIE
jgi:hypothetical protein